MKKGILVVLTVLCLVGLAGCSKDKLGGDSDTNSVTKTETPVKIDTKFVSEDYEPGNRTKYLLPMLKTDKGFYHYAYADGGLHYYDVATGKTMFLCNKPECKHDGNEFCVATNQKYLALGHCLYNDVILKYVVEKTDTQYRFKVISVALDGSAMNEVANVLEFEKPVGDFSIYQCFMYVHRNKVFLTMTGFGQAELEEYYGVALLDLNTREVTYLNEEPFSKNNVGVESITAAGDYFYYCKRDGKKLLLHRYNIETGTDESFRLLPNFAGDYVVLDEDRIAYIKRSGTVICTYQVSTGQNVEQTRMLSPQYEHRWDGTWQKSENKMESQVYQLATDGTYVYAAGGYTAYMGTGENGEQIVTEREAYIHVLSKELEEIALVDMGEAAATLGFDDMEWEESSYTQMLRYMGDEIYWNLIPKGTQDSERYVFRCKRSDFLTGEPKFTFVYRYEEN